MERKRNILPKIISNYWAQKRLAIGRVQKEKQNKKKKEKYKHNRFAATLWLSFKIPFLAI